MQSGMTQNLNQQTEDAFYGYTSKGIQQEIDKIEKESNIQSLDETVEDFKSIGTGLLTGTLAIPSDIISLAEMGNTWLADNTNSPLAMLIKENLQDFEKKYGREAFDKGFEELTGIKSDAGDMNQLVGEILSPTGLILGSLKYGSKVLPALSDGAAELASTVSNSVKNSDLYKTTEGMFEKATFGEGPLLETQKIFSDAPVTKIKEEPVIPNILNNVVAPNAQEAEKFYEIQTKYLADNKIFATKSATVEDPSGMTPAKEILKLKDKVAQVNYKKLSLEQKQELYRLTGGMYRGRDGKLRKRIDTRNATLTNNAINFVKGANLSGDIKVKDLINYQDLFKLHKGDKGFEDIQNIRIEFFESDPTKQYGRTASYNANPADGKGEVIRLSRPTDTVIRGNQEVFLNEAAKIDSLRQSLLHELQHAVQVRNKFDSGGSVRRFLSDDYFKDVAVNNSKINNSYANYIKDKLKLKTETDSSNNLYFFINGKRMFVGAGYNAEKLEVNFRKLFNSIGQKIINREYDEFFKQKKLYLGKDGLKLKSDEQHFMNILEKQGVLTSPHFNNFIQEMIIRQKEVRRLSKIENKAYEDYFKLPGEQESYSVATYDKLPKNVRVDEVNPRGSLLLDEDIEDVYTKSVIPKVDVTIGDDPNIQQALHADLKDVELITGYVNTGQSSKSGVGKNEIINRFENNPALKEKSINALNKKNAINPETNTVTVYRAIITRGGKEIEPETKTSASLSIDSLMKNINNFTKQEYSGGMGASSKLGDGDLYIAKYEVPKESVIGYLPAFKNDINPNVNDVLNSKGFGQENIKGFKTIDNQSDHAKKLIDDQDEILVDVSNVDMQIMKDIEGANRPINQMNTATKIIEKIAKKEIKTLDDLDAYLEGSSTSIASQADFKKAFDEKTSTKDVEQKARQKFLDYYKNYFSKSAK
jgi:hypothetical protein